MVIRGRFIACGEGNTFILPKIKTGTTSKNNPEFQLTSISKANDIKHEFKHSAESDTWRRCLLRD